MTACIAKDRAYTRMFGTAKPKPLPTMTYLLFATRDAGTVAASFNLPEPVSQALQEKYGLTKKRADFTAQMVCPAAVQFLSTPLHLWGLDLYNNPGNSMSSRVAIVAKNYLPSAFARIGRIGPAFGIGGVSNTAFRKELRSQVAGR